MSEYCIGGTRCFAVARGGPLLLFDQISKHIAGGRGCIFKIPNRPCYLPDEMTIDFERLLFLLYNFFGFYVSSSISEAVVANNITRHLIYFFRLIVSYFKASPCG